jgi:hypothetical protein
VRIEKKLDQVRKVESVAGFGAAGCCSEEAIVGRWMQCWVKMEESKIRGAFTSGRAREWPLVFSR